ncbi:Tn3 family transposase [Roseibium aggregatum]|nr:Tn3 family transposase [Roseibium aggregatum]
MASKTLNFMLCSFCCPFLHARASWANKVELANRFTRAVAVGSPREFIFTLQEDQQIAEACNRLIKNAIICWNYLYLETRLRAADPETRAEMMKTIKAHSPQSWAHINMLGEYDFSDKKLADCFDILPLKTSP